MFQPPFVNIIDPTATRLRAVDNGLVYLGKEDTDPTILANQIPVYYTDENGVTQQLSQPIQLNGSGVPVLSKSSGTIINPVFYADVVSIVIKYRSGKTCYSDKSYPSLNNYFKYLFSSSGYSYEGQWAPSIQVPAKSERVDGYALWEPTSGKIIIPLKDDAFITGSTIQDDFENKKFRFAYSIKSKVDISDYGAIEGVNTASARNTNRIAIESMMQSNNGAAHFPLGTWYTDPISSSIVETYVKPIFTGETRSLFESDNNVTVVNTNNQDFYYGGTKPDYSYSVRDIVFVGGSEFTARIFGTDFTDSFNREHRGTFYNVAFHQCDKGLYTKDFSSSLLMEEVMFRRCRYGHYARKGGGNSAFNRCRFDFCLNGLYTRGFQVAITSCHVGLGIQNSDAAKLTGRSKGISVAGYCTLSDIYGEPYGTNLTNAVMYECRIFDPERTTIIMDNCSMYVGDSTKDIDIAMDYNNGNWAWPEDWLSISNVTENKIPRFNMVANVSGQTNTRLLQGISIGNNDTLSVNESKGTAFFNKRKLIVEIDGTGGITTSAYSGWGLDINQIQYPKTNIKYYDLFVNKDDTISDGQLHDGNVIRFGYAGQYKFEGNLYIEVPSMTEGDEWAIAVRSRNNGYKLRLADKGKVFLSGGKKIINTSIDANMIADGKVGFYWGFVTNNGYKAPNDSDLNSSATLIEFSLAKVAAV